MLARVKKYGDANDNPSQSRPSATKIPPNCRRSETERAEIDCSVRKLAASTLQAS